MVEKKKLKNVADVTTESITPCTIPSLLTRGRPSLVKHPNQVLKYVSMSKYQPIHVLIISDDRDQLTTRRRNQHRATRAHLAANQDEAEPRASTSHSEQSPCKKSQWSFLDVHEFPSKTCGCVNHNHRPSDKARYVPPLGQEKWCNGYLARETRVEKACCQPSSLFAALL